MTGSVLCVLSTSLLAFFARIKKAKRDVEINRRVRRVFFRFFLNFASLELKRLKEMWKSIAVFLALLGVASAGMTYDDHKVNFAFCR